MESSLRRALRLGGAQTVLVVISAIPAIGSSVRDPTTPRIFSPSSTLRTTISKGRPGTAMSAFAQKEGGMLTDAQINAIIKGIRERWSKPDALAGATAPPYAARAAGSGEQGGAVYLTYCAYCHGTDAKGGPKAGSVTNGAYLSLISDQGLRTIVITGRPDFGAPDWRDNVPGHPMTDQQISDVVAWLVAQRPKQATETVSASASSTGGTQ